MLKKKKKNVSDSSWAVLLGLPQGQVGVDLAHSRFSEQSTGFETSASGRKSFTLKLPLIRLCTCLLSSSSSRQACRAPPSHSK